MSTNPAHRPPHPGRLVKLAREAVPFNQTDFARELGVTQQTVSRWETGVLRVPVKYVDAICRLTNQDVGARSVLLDAIAYQAANDTSADYSSEKDEIRQRLDNQGEAIGAIRDQMAEMKDTLRTFIAALQTSNGQGAAN